MATKDINLPLVVITGPTASGKTALAIDLAQRFGGEIICADSRTVYKGLDVGTAKPSVVEQKLVPHWGIDLIEPNERFSVADFKEYAVKAIQDIRARGHVPFLVGGTGLYVDAVILDYQFGREYDENTRQKLQRMTLDELYHYCEDNHINLPENDKNKRYVIRAIENAGHDSNRNVVPEFPKYIVGITTEKSELRERIGKRIEQMLENGVVDEAIMIAEKYGWDAESMKANLYPLLRKYVAGDLEISDLKTQAVTADWHLAKRQLTWLRRNKFIHWDDVEHLNTYLSGLLARI